MGDFTVAFGHRHPLVIFKSEQSQVEVPNKRNRILKYSSNN
jgi:hypothetical protein